MLVASMKTKTPTPMTKAMDGEDSDDNGESASDSTSTADDSDESEDDRDGSEDDSDGSEDDSQRSDNMFQIYQDNEQQAPASHGTRT